jgi:hypothetical protein
VKRSTRKSDFLSQTSMSSMEAMRQDFAKTALNFKKQNQSLIQDQNPNAYHDIKDMLESNVAKLSHVTRQGLVKTQQACLNETTPDLKTKKVNNSPSVQHKSTMSEARKASSGTYMGIDPFVSHIAPNQSEMQQFFYPEISVQHNSKPKSN